MKAHYIVRANICIFQILIGGNYVRSQFLKSLIHVIFKVFARVHVFFLLIESLRKEIHTTNSCARRYAINDGGEYMVNVVNIISLW